MSRLLEADYNSGATVYAYGYDPAGNLVNTNGTTRTYNALNQMVNDGTNTLTYDANGNLTNDGVNAYIWDEANRLLTAPGNTAYAYDGAGNRISQTVSSVVTTYLNDLQPGLTKLLAQTTGSNTERFIHAPRGIHQVEDNAGTWLTYLHDGLGSVRSHMDSAAQVQMTMSYDPYGQPQGSYGAGFGFTGEYTDPNGQLYLRARYYDLALSTFTSLDLFEGLAQHPMSLNAYARMEGDLVMDAIGEPFFHNRYSYANSNPVNRVDPSGNVAVEIWAAAFIKPKRIRLPYGIDLAAIWEGDNRSWHTRHDFDNPFPPSSRVWWQVGFDTEDLSNIYKAQDTGETLVVFNGLDRVYPARDKAPAPPAATVECTDTGFLIVEIQDKATNPMNFLIQPPPIEIYYRIAFLPSGGIVVRQEIDRFPWHELHIAIDGMSVVQMTQEPLGPTQTPVDLAFAPISDIVEFDHLSVTSGACNSTGRGNRLPVVDVGIDLDCLFV